MLCGHYEPERKVGALPLQQDTGVRQIMMKSPIVRIALSLIITVFLLPAVCGFADELSNTPADDAANVGAEYGSTEDSSENLRIENCCENLQKDSAAITDASSSTQQDAVLTLAAVNADERKLLTETPLMTDCMEEKTVPSDCDSASDDTTSDKPNPVIALPAAVYIQDLTAGTSPANQKYSYISFFFSDSENKKQYECYITGLEIGDGSQYDDTTKDRYEKLCRDIAEAFYLGKTFDLADDNSYNLSITPIDAEKQNKYLPDPFEDEKYKDEDTGFCWVSETSNLFVYSGWADQALEDQTITSPMTEDDVFNYMKERFYNSGSSAYSGLKYLFEGEYNAQMADNNGGISFDYNSNVAQLRSESHVSSAGLLKNYPVDSVLEVKSINDMVKDSKEEFSEDIQKLKTGVAIGLSQSAHAMTLFGYIIDSSLQGFNSVKALFLADSDNHAYEYEDIDHPPEGMIPKENLPNTYTMYTELSDPSSEEPVGIHVESWLLLKPSSAVSKTETPPAGCCASNTVDLVAYSLAAGEEMQWVVHSNAVVGTTIKLSAEFQNASYKAIDFSKVPQIQGTIAVLLNGESHQTIPVTYTLLESDCEANAKTAYTVPYHIESAGSYSFQFSIEGIFYNDGTKAVELYQYNNVCHKLCTVYVPAQAAPSDRTGIPTYTLTLSKSNGVFEIVFPAVCSDFGRLMLNGNPVDSARYSISSLQDGMFRLCFSKELIDSLSAGSSTFTLFNLNGQPVAFFVIEK